MTNTIFARTFAIALTPALALASIPVAAIAAEQAPAQSISFSDLDLSTAEGQRRLDARIDRAARNICQVDRAMTGSRLVSRDALSCYRKALHSARERVAAAVARTSQGG